MEVAVVMVVVEVWGRERRGVFFFFLVGREVVRETKREKKKKSIAPRGRRKNIHAEMH